MASVFDRIARRKAYPVEMNGGTIFVCEPTFKQVKRVQKLEGDAATGMALACCIVNEDGSEVFAQAEGEDDAAFAVRVLDEASVLTPSELKTIQEAIFRLISPANQDELTKN